jgi:hypothetical protein
VHCDEFNELYFQQDGTPHHYMLAVHNYVNKVSAGHVIRRRGSSRSPILKVMEFFWGMARDKMFKHKTKI